MAKEDDQKEAWWEDLPPEIVDFVYRLEIDIPGKGTVSKDLRPDLKINELMIEDHLRLNAAARYFWGSVHADMRTRAGKLELVAKARRGVVRKTVIEELRKTDIKQTDKLVDSMVDSDVELLKIEEEIQDTWNKANKLFALLASLDMRHESLRTLAGFKKAERQL